VEATANAKKKDSSGMTSEATRVAVAKLSKCSAESSSMNSDEVESSTLTKFDEHSKAVQAKQCAQKQSHSIVKSDDESIEVMESIVDKEDSKPATSTAIDNAVNYGGVNFFQNW